MLLGPPAREERSRRRVKLAVALGLALLAHLAAFGVLVLLPAPDRVTRAPKTPPRPVALRSIRADEWAKNRGDAPPARSLAEAKKKIEKKVEKEPDGQVVAVERGNGEAAPDAKFLSEHSNRVEKETRAREQSRNSVNPTARRTSPNPSKAKGHDDVPLPIVFGNDGLADEDAAKSRGNGNRAASEIPDIAQRSELLVRRTDPKEPGAGSRTKVAERLGSDEIRGNSDRLMIFPGAPDGEQGRPASSGRPGAPGLRTLVPSESKVSQLYGAPSADHLEDVEEGDGTFLNTREWKYASFFNRVKQSVGAHWNPSEKLVVRDPTGSIYGGRDRATLVHVTLDEAGQLKEVYVQKSSGLDFLDLEAIKAFERAAPFPHPPPGLLASDSTVRFTFGFFLDMSGGGLRIRGFRQPN